MKLSSWKKERRSGLFQKQLRNRILAGCAGAGVLVLAGWAVFGGHGGRKVVVATPDEAKAALTEENLAELQAMPPEKRKAKLEAYGRAISADFSLRRDGPRDGQPREEPALRKALEKLSDEDRDAFRRGMSDNMRKQRAQREKEMDERIVAFFKASPEEQKKQMEEEIAKSEERRQQWQQRSQQTDAGKPGDTGSPGKPGDKKPDDKAGNNNRPRGNWASIPKEKIEERRREHLDTTDPEMRALRTEYFNRLREAQKSKEQTAAK